MIYTFYSFKGGVGRSMALANVAELLYRRGLKVLLVDFDLEAPGLERYFDVAQALNKPDDIINQRGLVDLLISYKNLRSLPRLDLPPSGATQPATEQPTEPVTRQPAEQTAFPYPVEPLGNFIVPVYNDSTNGGGSLSLISSGRRGGDEFIRYADRVRGFNWDDFYAKWNGEQFFDWFRAEAEKVAEVVLIDSRTGVTEMSGVCTYQLADVVVMFVTPGFQSLDGTLKLARSLANPALIEKGRKGRNLSLLFVPSRVESGEGDKLDEFADNFQENFSRLIPSTLRFDKGPFIDLKVPYIPHYAFAEKVAVREPDRPKAADLITAFEKVTATLAQFEPETSPFGKLYHKVRTSEQFVGRAESFFASLTPDEQKSAERLFTRLVQIEETEDRSQDTRARINVKQFTPAELQVARKMANTQLLIIESSKTSGEETVQIADDALVRDWQRLRDWINVNPHLFRWRQELQKDLERWEKSERHSSTLLTGVLLSSAERLLPVAGDRLNESEKEYIIASSKYQRRQQLLRYAQVGFFLLVVLGFVGLSFYRNWADQKRELAIKEAAEKTLQATEFNTTGVDAAGRDDFDAAINSYNQALQVKPDYADAYQNRGIAYAEKGMYDQAIADFDHAIKLKPESADAYFSRGVVSAKASDPSNAINDFSEAIGRRKDYTDAYKQRGLAYARLNRYDQAITDFTDALSIAPNDAEALAGRASAFSNKGAYDKATTDYAEAIRQKPDYAEAYLGRGNAYKAMGNKDQAIADLQISLKFTNDPVILSRAKTSLQELGKKVQMPVTPPATARIYVQYNNDSDKATANTVAALLTKNGYAVNGTRQNDGRTSGDIRYYFEEDKRNAESIRKVVADGLSALGVRVSMGLISLAGRFPNVTRGHIEVWLPTLTAASGKQTPAYTPGKKPGGDKRPAGDKTTTSDKTPTYDKQPGSDKKKRPRERAGK